ncbi:hypothetical protein FQA39_LY04373 [Lamprigera yunnana]|nr:hypothetical protein FQA39_LY04373 [Lamprigera yunnana]
MIIALRRCGNRVSSKLDFCVNEGLKKLYCCKSEHDENANGPSKEGPPEEPTTCCMSNCPNCVWVEYATKLSEYYKDGGEKAIKEINEKITDPGVKAYILMEIRMRNKSV